MITFVVMALGVILDRVTKFFVLSTMQEGESISVWHDFFYLSCIKNQGIAFGLFPTHKNFFVVTTIIIICILLYYWKSIPKGNTWVQIAIGLILGGALGNLWDRIAFGSVIDFIDIGCNNYRWPAFNLADSIICVGVSMTLIDFMRSGSSGTKAQQVVNS
ncbi:MAG: signal peptidase II [Candidatus Desantisbacteria bacterium]